MGRSGPSAEPIPIRKLKGETRPSLVGEAIWEADPLETLPRPPAWLPRGARTVWRRVLDELVRYRVISEVDLDLFAHYCYAADLARRAAVELDDVSGGTVTVEQLVAVRKPRKDGEEPEDPIVAQVIVKPAFKAWREAVQSMRQLAGEFGLTPAIRASIKLPAGSSGQANEDDAARLLS